MQRHCGGHAFRGDGYFGGVSYNKFGLEVLGEEWVSHHGAHKKQGARSVVEGDAAKHPILNAVQDIFCPSVVYGVVHLQDSDDILLRAAVTESLDPDSPAIEGPKNDPMQPFAWLRDYAKPNSCGSGQAFCTTGGASVDFVDENIGVRQAAILTKEQGQADRAGKCVQA